MYIWSVIRKSLGFGFQKISWIWRFGLLRFVFIDPCNGEFFHLWFSKTCACYISKFGIDACREALYSTKEDNPNRPAYLSPRGSITQQHF